jgi:hypothetical protein
MPSRNIFRFFSAPENRRNSAFRRPYKGAETENSYVSEMEQKLIGQPLGEPKREGRQRTILPPQYRVTHGGPAAVVCKNRGRQKRVTQNE